MKQVDLFIKKLQSYVGYAEEADGTTIFGKSYGERHNSKYFDNAPWCMMTLAEAARYLDIPDTIIPDTASCPTCLRWAEERGLRIGDNEPAHKGDIVLYEWNPAKKDGVDHVGLVEYVEGNDPDTQILHLIEGNWGDKVARTSYKYRDSRVWAIFRPPYSTEEIKEEVEEKASVSKVKVSLNVLKNGSEGENVKALQILLNGHECSCGAVDGIFGPNTLAATKKFQKAKALEVDGIVGVNTWTALLE